MKVTLRAATWSYDTDAVSLATGLECKDLSLTKQSDAEDADINEIVRRFGLTGELPQNYRAPTYQDFGDVTDFHSAMNAVRDASERFMMMPPGLRARFDNDPQKLIAFVGDETNRQAAIDLGLIPPPPAAPPEPPKGSNTPA